MDKFPAVIRFDESVIKPGPLYHNGQPLRVPVMIPISNISAFYCQNEKLRIQMGQIILEVPQNTVQSQYLSEQAASGYHSQTDTYWQSIVHSELNYYLNFSRVSCLSVYEHRIRAYQQAGPFWFANTSTSDVWRSMVNSQTGWIGPFQGVDENTVYINLNEVDMVSFIGNRANISLHGSKSNPITIIDDDNILKTNIENQNSWVFLGTASWLNVGCASHYAFGNHPTQSRHDTPGLHFGSGLVQFVPILGDNGHTRQSEFEKYVQLWPLLEYVKSTAGIRINPKRIEMLGTDFSENPQHFLMWNEGRYQRHGPLTDTVRQLLNSFTVVSPST